MSKNHTKTIRRKSNNKNKPTRIMTQQDLSNLVMYAAFTSYYLNDCACNSCLQLEEFVKKLPHTKDTLIIKQKYDSLKSRSLNYFKKLNDVLKDDVTVFASIFGVLDDNCDKPIINFRNKVEEVLIREKVDNAGFYAKIIETDTLCNFAVQQNLIMIERLKPYFEDMRCLNEWNIKDIAKASDVFKITVLRKSKYKNDIDFNKEPKVCNAFRRIGVKMFSFESFMKAFNKAAQELDDECKNIKE